MATRCSLLVRGFAGEKLGRGLYPHPSLPPARGKEVEGFPARGKEMEEFPARGRETEEPSEQFERARR